MVLTKQETLQLRSALQDAVVKCSERCLYQSAKWAAELLTSIPEAATTEPDHSMHQPPAHPVPLLVSQNVDPAEARLEAAEINKYLLAKSFFDCREYDRCAAVFLPDSLTSGVLSSHRQNHPDPFADEPYPISGMAGKGASQSSFQQQSTFGSRPGHGHGATWRNGRGNPTSFGQPNAAGLSGSHEGNPVEAPTASTSATPLEAEPVRILPELSQKSLFLALYAKMISGEKKKDEEVEMVMGPHDTGDVVNRQLQIISAYLQAWFDQNTDEDEERVVSQGWLEYLYGMVLAKDRNEKEAMEWFIRSVHRFPMNWGCWQEMTNLISRVDELNKIAPRLPQNIVSFIFHLYASLELYQQGHNLANSLEQLLSIFPTSSFLLTCNALLAYHSKDLFAAEQHFSALLAQHPHRLDSLDHYSNILYVLNLRPKLAFLAHLCSSLDKFRPETCVVIGNYYSLMSSHEKAVQYFRRALALDRSCLSAWTLMGHEYVELKNTHAAIESYRRAVDVNRRDYRAWYGLGQTYEVLELHTYALWYYRKAAGLRPWDGKMWMAVGSCLQKMGRERDGIKVLKRALMADSTYESAGGNFGGNGRGVAPGHMDPEVLLQIALMYDQLGDREEAKSYMELCMAQEEGEPEANLGDSIALHRESTSMGGPGAGGGGGVAVDDDEGDGGGGTGNEGTGVTPATSKARLWLARFALNDGEDLVATGAVCPERRRVSRREAAGLGAVPRRRRGGRGEGVGQGGCSRSGTTTKTSWAGWQLGTPDLAPNVLHKCLDKTCHFLRSPRNEVMDGLRRAVEQNVIMNNDP
ncbi:anaphase-promoting complex subunit Apc8 [Niveomyces insectorum RCEF 264]|uniref:Anaphase-promoting complex subunit Apc8 n=1 Tax=Niveomyces insectorum RCEF 264 TaxID=1081102 RepID=A0A167RUN9_9HYPO|nr:anaphase-promoting complex subunit Apc8 [Niveomyces insectorum RCEF 264]